MIASALLVAELRSPWLQASAAGHYAFFMN
jgi:hypothetical protein